MFKRFACLYREVTASRLAKVSLAIVLAILIFAWALLAGAELDASFRWYLVILGTPVWWIARPLLPATLRTGDLIDHELAQLVWVLPAFLLFATIIAAAIVIIRRRSGKGLASSVVVGYLTAAAALQTAGVAPWILLALMLRNYGDPMPPTPNPTNAYVATQNAHVRETRFAQSSLRPRVDPIVFEHDQNNYIEDGRNLAFNPEGTIVAVNLIPELPIYLIDARDGSVSGTLDLPSHPPRVISVAFSPDGSQLIVSACSAVEPAPPCSEHELSFWAIDTLTEDAPRIDGVEIAFSPDGALMASLDHGTLQVWNAVTRQPLFVLPIDQEDPSVYAIAFSPDGRHLAVALPEGVTLWELHPTPRQVARLFQAEHAREDLRYHRLVYSPNGQLLCAVGSDSQIYLWDTSTLTLLDRGYFGSHKTGPIFTPDGKYIVFGGYSNTLHMRGAIEPQYLEVPLDPDISGTTIVGVAISPDGRTWAVLSADYTLRLLDPQDLLR